MQTQNIPVHHKYKLVDIKEADAVAYVFINKTDPPVQYPFKFPELKDTELRIKQLYTGLCASDMMHTRQNWGPIIYPSCPGHEILGIVTMVGSKVQKFKVGQRVAFSVFRDHCGKCATCADGNDQLCQGVPGVERESYTDEYFGGYATHFQGIADHFYNVPEGLPSDKTPPLLCAGVTVYAPLKRFLKQGKQQSCGVVGVGGLGHLAVQYANKLGMQVTAFTSSAQTKSNMLKSLGATYIKSSTDKNELKQEENKYDIIVLSLYTKDAELLSSYVNLLVPGGTLIIVGIGNYQQNMDINLFSTIVKEIQIAGSCVGNQKEIVEMLEFSDKHKVLPMCEIFDFENFPKAFDRLENGKPEFRCVVNIADWAKKNGFDK